MVGRPKRFDESEALREAMLVFWRRGYEAASCDELLAAMGINCGSMYSTFGDKRALFEKAFDLYHAEVFSKMASVINGTGTPIENVRALVKCWEKGLAESECRGCLISHTLIEFGDSGDPIAKRAKKLLDQVRSAIEKQLRAAKRRGELRSKLNSQGFVCHVDQYRARDDGDGPRRSRKRCLPWGDPIHIGDAVLKQTFVCSFF